MRRVQFYDAIQLREHRQYGVAYGVANAPARLKSRVAGLFGFRPRRPSMTVVGVDCFAFTDDALCTAPG